VIEIQLDAVVGSDSDHLQGLASLLAIYQALPGSKLFASSAKLGLGGSSVVASLRFSLPEKP